MAYKALSYDKINIDGGFWQKKQEMLRKTTVWAVYDRFKETGRFDALKCLYKEGDDFVEWQALSSVTFESTEGWVIRNTETGEITPFDVTNPSQTATRLKNYTPPNSINLFYTDNLVIEKR